MLGDAHQCGAKHLGIAGGLGLGAGLCLAAGQIKAGLGVIAHLVGLGVGIALPLGGGHVDHHGTLTVVGRREGPDHGGDVMPINGTHIGESQLFKDRPHLRHSQTLHALLDATQLGGNLTTQKGEVAHAFLHGITKELDRRAQTQLVQIARQRPHRW